MGWELKGHEKSRTTKASCRLKLGIRTAEKVRGAEKEEVAGRALLSKPLQWASAGRKISRPSPFTASVHSTLPRSSGAGVLLLQLFYVCLSSLT